MPAFVVLCLLPVPAPAVSQTTTGSEQEDQEAVCTAEDVSSCGGTIPNPLGVSLLQKRAQLQMKTGTEQENQLSSDMEEESRQRMMEATQKKKKDDDLGSGRETKEEEDPEEKKKMTELLEQATARYGEAAVSDFIAAERRQGRIMSDLLARATAEDGDGFFPKNHWKDLDRSVTTKTTTTTAVQAAPPKAAKPAKEEKKSSGGEAAGDGGAPVPQGSTGSYQPPIPAAQPTPDSWWSPGQGFVAVKFNTECPPWLPGYKAGAGDWRTHCKRDTAELFAKYIKPNNRCGPRGECPPPGVSLPRADKPDRASCVNYNNQSWYPEYSSAGYCITAAGQMPASHNLGYIEVGVGMYPTVNGDLFAVKALKWAQQDAPARVTCDSFCKYCDKATEYCPDTSTSPIASGEYGHCNCHCRAGAKAADFDRCTTVSENVCSDAAYCGGHGRATFSPGVGPSTLVGWPPAVQQAGVGKDEGTCQCTCESGYYGRNCELRHGDKCTINDCAHKTWEKAEGYGGGSAVLRADEGAGVSGTRPNCQCKCSENGGERPFGTGGKDCSTWTSRFECQGCTNPDGEFTGAAGAGACKWGESPCTLPVTSTQFTIQDPFRDSTGESFEGPRGSAPAIRVAGSHDPSKCRENGKLDVDCCAKVNDRGCADGYVLVEKSGGIWDSTNGPWCGPQHFKRGSHRYECRSADATKMPDTPTPR